MSPRTVLGEKEDRWVDMSARVLDFFVRSSFLALLMTGIPVAVLVILWELRLTTPTILVAWMMMTLTWTFYILLKGSQKLIGSG